MRKALLALPLLLAACAPVEGEVVEKEYEPARTMWRTEPDYKTRCTSTAKTRTCRQVYVGTEQVRHYQPECWELEIKPRQREASEICVSEAEYRRYEVGDWYRPDGG